MGDLARQFVVDHKTQRINRYYYIYGLDRKNVDTAKHVLSYRPFTKIRDSRNLKLEGMNFNYASVLRDKFVFGQFLSSLNIPTPKNIALMNSNDVTWLNTMQTDPLSSIANDPQTNINGFCKKLTGLQGLGAFPLRIAESKIYIDDVECSSSALSEKIDGKYLLQERIAQHPELEEYLSALTLEAEGCAKQDIINLITVVACKCTLTRV